MKIVQTNNNHTDEDIRDCIEFIQEYRNLEKMQYLQANSFLETIFAQKPKYQIKAIIEKWKNKKKKFGDFFFGLDVDMLICLYTYWGIDDPEAESFIQNTKENPMAKLFISPSNKYLRIRNLLMFFENHGINPQATSFLTLNSIPESNGEGSFSESNPRFGNATNWGKYILGLGEQEQQRIVRTILENYQTDQYKN